MSGLEGALCKPTAEKQKGGTLLPYDRQLIDGLMEENIMRGLVHIIQTGSGEHKIPVVASHGAGSWIDEEQAMEMLLQLRRRR